ncbi:MAG: hypothetical protein P4M00_10340 [Azospirillaceae bacterium]|nr:hypothetical protein [Azospirillaceae bacterium]
MTTTVTGTAAPNSNSRQPSSSTVSPPAGTADTFSAYTRQSSPASPLSAADLNSHPLAGYAPAIKMSADQLAAMQASPFRAPDPAETAAQSNDKAYALITDTKTGKLVGGVWPEVAIVSGPNIADDSRLTGSTDMNEATQALAQDIQQATGDSMSIQYFQPDDPNAPTFGSTIGKL